MVHLMIYKDEHRPGGGQRGRAAAAAEEEVKGATTCVKANWIKTLCVC